MIRRFLDRLRLRAPIDVLVDALQPLRPQPLRAVALTHATIDPAGRFAPGTCAVDRCAVCITNIVRGSVPATGHEGA